jgi:hypothetical protein
MGGQTRDRRNRAGRLPWRRQLFLAEESGVERYLVDWVTSQITHSPTATKPSTNLTKNEAT